MKNKSLNYLLLFVFLFTAGNAFSEVKLPKVLSDNMVLQQEKPVCIWGTADPGENVTVKFEKQTRKTKADENGNWSVTLNGLKANKKPQQLTVQGKKNKITRKNILVGEVWLVSGQSNMEYTMNKHPHYKKPQKGDPDYAVKAYKEANSPIIRTLYVERNLKTDTLPSKGWEMINPESLAPVSMIGYFFAKKLTEDLDVPVGIISTSWGGTPIEVWTPKQAYLDSPIFRDLVQGDKLGNMTIGDRYEKMVKPLIPYSLRGFLWYQGETNLMDGDRANYADKQQVLLESWRSLWNDRELPFYYVQLAPYTYSARRNDRQAHTWEALPEFWEVQTGFMNKVSNTGMVCVTDLVDDVKDIHPSYKWIVAERLANWALAETYQQEGIVYRNPIYKGMKIEGDNIIVEFDQVGSGLTTRDGKAPDWFQVKAKNGIYTTIKEAVLEGNKVILPKKSAAEPVVVRFGWDEIAMPNLMNKEGLPVLPFRTGK